MLYIAFLSSVARMHIDPGLRVENDGVSRCDNSTATRASRFPEFLLGEEVVLARPRGHRPDMAMFRTPIGRRRVAMFPPDRAVATGPAFWVFRAQAHRAPRQAENHGATEGRPTASPAVDNCCQAYQSTEDLAATTKTPFERRQIRFAQGASVQPCERATASGPSCKN